MLSPVFLPQVWDNLNAKWVVNQTSAIEIFIDLNIMYCEWNEKVEVGKEPEPWLRRYCFSWRWEIEGKVNLLLTVHPRGPGIDWACSALPTRLLSSEVAQWIVRPLAVLVRNIRWDRYYIAGLKNCLGWSFWQWSKFTEASELKRPTYDICRRLDLPIIKFFGQISILPLDNFGDDSYV